MPPEGKMDSSAPLAVFRYTLTWQDALAYERLPKTMPGIQQATLYIWLAIAGVLWIALPPELVGDNGTPRFWLSGVALLVLQYLIFRLARAVARLNRARHRYPAGVEMVVSQWPDRLSVERDGTTRVIAFEEIGALLPTAERLFIAAGRDLVIIPATAAGGAEGMARLVESIDGFMRQRYEARDGAPGARAS